jgi:hypothetical protein
MRGSLDAELGQEMQDLCVPHAADTKYKIFAIGRGLDSQHLFSLSPVDSSCDADNQSTC